MKEWWPHRGHSDRIILNGSLMSEISDKAMKLQEKIIDNICWSKNGAVSLSYFFAFQCFFYSTVFLEVSTFLFEVSKAEQITGTFRGSLQVFVAAAVSVSGQRTSTSIILFYPCNSTMSWILWLPFYSRGNWGLMRSSNSLQFCWLGTGGMCVCMQAQSSPTLCDLLNQSWPGSSVHGVSQERILEWVAISSFRGSS